MTLYSDQCADCCNLISKNNAVTGEPLSYCQIAEKLDRTMLKDRILFESFENNARNKRCTEHLPVSVEPDAYRTVDAL